MQHETILPGLPRRSLLAIRGLPGSGKTTLARVLTSASPKGIMHEADSYFEGPDAPAWDWKLLEAAHTDCKERVWASLRSDYALVVVSNVFAQKWMLNPYYNMAQQLDCPFFVVDLYDAGMSDEQLFKRCVHGVPLKTIGNMRKKWEHGLRGRSPYRSGNR